MGGVEDWGAFGLGTSPNPRVMTLEGNGFEKVDSESRRFGRVPEVLFGCCYSGLRLSVLSLPLLKGSMLTLDIGIRHLGL